MSRRALEKEYTDNGYQIEDTSGQPIDPSAEISESILLLEGQIARG